MASATTPDFKSKATSSEVVLFGVAIVQQLQLNTEENKQQLVSPPMNFTSSRNSR
jgi:hypothetical protein